MTDFMRRLFDQAPVSNTTDEANIRNYYDGIKSNQEVTIRSLIDDVLTHLADPRAFIEMCRDEAARNPSSKYAPYHIEAANIVERYIAEGVYKDVG